MRKTSLCALGAVGLATVLAFGGFYAREAQAAPCDGPAEVAKITLMADWIPVAVSQGPFWEAFLNGYYKDEGLEVEIIAPANPADPIKLVARERVNFSLTYVPEVMMSRDTGIPVIAVATTLRKLVSGFMSLSETGIKSPADLKGKIVGVPPKMDFQAFFKTVVKTGGIGAKDVKMIDPGFGGIKLLLAKKVDATGALTYFEEVIANLALSKEGKPPVNFLLFADNGVPQFYYQLVVANENWVKKNPHATCRFLRASIRGVKQWVENADTSFDYILKKNDVFTLEEQRLGYEMAKPDWVAADGTIFGMDVEPWRTAQAWALEQKLITVGADPSSYFTNEYLPKK